MKKGILSSILYYNIFWVEILEDCSWFVVDYVYEDSLYYFMVCNLKFVVLVQIVEQIDDYMIKWVESFLKWVYGIVVCCKCVWVLVNFYVGLGGVDKIWDKEVKFIFEVVCIFMMIVWIIYLGEVVDLV